MSELTEELRRHLDHFWATKVRGHTALMRSEAKTVAELARKSCDRLEKIEASHEDLVEACKQGFNEIVGQLESGILKDSFGSNRLYWRQLAGVFKTALAKAKVKE